MLSIGLSVITFILTTPAVPFCEYKLMVRIRVDRGKGIELERAVVHMDIMDKSNSCLRRRWES